MKRVLLVATVQSHIAQFHKPLINMLHELGCEVDVAARNNLSEKNGLTLTQPDNIYSVPFDRSPISPSNIKAYKELRSIIINGNYDVVHCNTPVGGILTRIICSPLRKKGLKVIYTAHGFHFYKGAPIKNWLLYYPIEKIFARFTDVLITINKEDYLFSTKCLKPYRIEYLPGVGVELKKFSDAVVDRNKMRQSIDVPEEAFVLISVGELNENKNQQVIIRAVADVGLDNAHYVLVGNGPNQGRLEKLAKDLGVSDKLHFAGYRRDVAQLYKASDVCCFTSVREGLGLACIEAIACGLPVIASKNRGTNDLINDGENGIICDCNDVQAFAQAIKQMYNSRNDNIEFKNSARSVSEYDSENVVECLKKIYSDLII